MSIETRSLKYQNPAAPFGATGFGIVPRVVGPCQPRAIVVGNGAGVGGDGGGHVPDRLDWSVLFDPVNILQIDDQPQ